MPLTRAEALSVERAMLVALAKDAARERPEIARRLKEVTCEILRAELGECDGSSRPASAGGLGQERAGPHYWWIDR